MKTILAYVLVPLAGVPAAGADQRAESPDVWRDFAAKLPPGAFVSVTLKDGASVKGHVIQALPNLLRVNPKTRIPVPTRDVRYDDIQWISRLKEGKSPGTKVLIGVGIAAGSLFGLFLVALAAICD